MSDYWIGQVFNCAVMVIMGAVACWFYRARLATPVKLKGYQYRLFALRDRAVRMVVDGTIPENDPEWKRIYAHVNDFAHAASVSRMTNGLRFVLAMLSSGPPTIAQKKAFDRLPSALRGFLFDYTKTVLEICWEGSWVLRLAARAAGRVTVIASLLKRLKPLESESYRLWRRTSDMLHAA